MGTVLLLRVLYQDPLFSETPMYLELDRDRPHDLNLKPVP